MRSENSLPHILNLVLIILLTCGHILFVSSESSFAQEDTWSMEIIGYGQKLPMSTNISSVSLGLNAYAQSANMPPLSPNPTIELQLSSDLSKDIRVLNYQREMWILIVEIGSYADYNAEKYYPLLEWNQVQISDARLKLLQGNTAEGMVLVENMGDTTSYQTKAADGQYLPSINKSFLVYTILYEPPPKNTYYHDQDSDGFGDPNEMMEAYTQPAFYVSNNTDCDDTHDNVYPGRAELCDDLDNDCNHLVDEGVLLTYYLDADGDGCGNPLVSQEACINPQGYVDNQLDCDDSKPDINPFTPLSGQSWLSLPYGRNFFTYLNLSCSPFSSYRLLLDLNQLGIKLNMFYKNPLDGPSIPTYWFFGQVSGDKIEFPVEPGGLFVLDRLL